MGPSEQLERYRRTLRTRKACHHFASHRRAAGGQSRWANCGITVNCSTSLSGGTSRSVTSKPRLARRGPFCSHYSPCSSSAFSSVNWRIFHPTACPTRSFITARCFPGCISQQPCRMRPTPSSKISGSSRRSISRGWPCRFRLSFQVWLTSAVSFLMFLVLMVYYRVRPGAADTVAARVSVAGNSDSSGRGVVAFRD